MVGSRNAVVALKPPSKFAFYYIGELGSRNAVVALKPFRFRRFSRQPEGKQERRGGIETRRKQDDQITVAEEAGTPWWH